VAGYYILTCSFLLNFLFGYFGTRYYIKFLQFVVTQYAKKSIRKRIEERLLKLAYLFGLSEDYNPLESDWWRANKSKVTRAVKIFSALAFLMYATKKLVAYVFPSVPAESETKRMLDQVCSEAAGPSVTPVSVQLDEYERLTGCGKSYRRIGIQNHTLWNVQEIPTSPCLFTGSPSDLQVSVSRNVRKFRIVIDGREDQKHPSRSMRKYRFN